MLPSRVNLDLLGVTQQFSSLVDYFGGNCRISKQDCFLLASLSQDKTAADRIWPTMEPLPLTGLLSFWVFSQRCSQQSRHGAPFGHTPQKKQKEARASLEQHPSRFHADVGPLLTCKSSILLQVTVDVKSSPDCGPCFDMAVRLGPTQWLPPVGLSG